VNFFARKATEMSAPSDDPSEYLRAAATRDILEQTRMFDSKKWLWVPDDEEGFKTACVKKQTGDTCLLELSDGSVSCTICLLARPNLLGPNANCA